MRKDAFTLLELLIVLAIISILCGLGLSSYRRQYARAQFRSGVIQIQVDLHRTRLLAMQSGEAYVFRFVPGSSVYEIAPLKTLQDAIYRANGDIDDETDSFGELAAKPSRSLDPYSTESLFSDDLFSSENIEADMAAFRANSQSAIPNGLTDGLGGGSASLDGSNLGSTAFDNGYGADALGSGGAFAYDFGSTFGSNNSLPTTLRELNAQEKTLARENALAWRVGANGALIRKQVQGDAIFTLLRTSKSTPSNLKSKRERGVDEEKEEEKGIGGIDPFDSAEASEGEDLGSRVSGTLTGAPTALSDEEDQTLGREFSSIASSSSEPEETLGGINDSEGARASLWSDPIVFFPNGKTSSAVIGIACVGEFQYFSEIALRGMTGVARITQISALPPGADPDASVLTTDQLFRLSNPNLSDEELAKQGIATSGDASKTAWDGLDAGGGSTDAAGDAFGAPGQSGIDGMEPALGAQASGGGYGSTERMSGYNFNANPAEALPVGAPLDDPIPNVGPGANDLGGGVPGAPPLNAVGGENMLGAAVNEPGPLGPNATNPLDAVGDANALGVPAVENAPLGSNADDSGNATLAPARGGTL